MKRLTTTGTTTKTTTRDEDEKIKDKMKNDDGMTACEQQLVQKYPFKKRLNWDGNTRIDEDNFM